MGEIKAPRLIPKTKILKPASRRESFSPYKLPTISDTFGFNSPVPRIIRAIEMNRAV